MGFWRNGGNITESSAILPPIRPYEELTKRGSVQHINYMLFIRGILVPIDSEGAANNIRKIRLAHDYKKKVAYVSRRWLDSNVD